MKTNLLFTVFFSGILSSNSYSQNTWVKKADFAGTARSGAVGFSIGNKGYIGTGHIQGSQGNPLSYKKDFWEWNQVTNTWTQKADFAGKARFGSVGFSIGTKGYIGTGQSGFSPSGYEFEKDFWEWDQATNVWTKKSDFPGLERSSAVGFSIGAKGYVGTGSLLNDFWEWDQATDIWIKKADLPSGLEGAVGFSIGTKGYIGTGGGWSTVNGSTLTRDFWEWDQVTDTWTKKADFGGYQVGNASGFSIGNKGYIGCGYVSGIGVIDDFWEWNQATNTWTQKANYGGGKGNARVGFAINGKGYIGTGVFFDWANNQFQYKNDFWEYAPEIGGGTTGMNEIKNDATLSVFPNPTSNAVIINFSSSVKSALLVTVKNELGQVVYSESKKNFEGEYLNTIDLSNQPTGVYFVEIILGNERRTRKIILE